MSKSRALLPYRVLRPDAIEPDPTGWAAFAGSELIAQLTDGCAFAQWDANLEFRLERDFSVNVDVANEVGIDGDDCRLQLVVTASSAGSSVRQVLFRTEVAAHEQTQVRVVASPSSETLALDLVLTTGLYLSHDLAPTDALAPKVQGSRLWEHTDRFRLEGGAMRLPIYEVSFASTFPGQEIDKSDFHVEVADDPELNLETGLVVYLNSDKPEFVAEATRAGSEAERRLWSGVLRRALTSMLVDEGQFKPGPYPRESLGATLSRWAQQIWPHVPSEQLRGLPKAGYSRFDAQIESWLAQFEEKTGEGVR